VENLAKVEHKMIANCSTPDGGRAHCSECLRKSNGDKGVETVYGGNQKGGIDVGCGQSDPRGSFFAH
jgi:hypothetical protein